MAKTALIMTPGKAGTEGTVIRTRNARSTGQPVQLVKIALHDYEVRCVHGNALRGNKRYEVARQAASPEEWCDECRAVMEAREAERNAPEPETEPEEETVTEDETKESTVDATEAAISVAEEFGINLAEVEGTGANGRILKGDVVALAEELVNA